MLRQRRLHRHTDYPRLRWQPNRRQDHHEAALHKLLLKLTCRESIREDEAMKEPSKGRDGNDEPPNGLPISRRERAIRTVKKPRISREAVGCMGVFGAPVEDARVGSRIR